MRANTLIFSSLLACLCVAVNATAASSQAPREHQVGVEIVADDGRVLNRYDLLERSERGKLRAYLEAERGRNYGIRVHNHTGDRGAGSRGRITGTLLTC